MPANIEIKARLKDRSAALATAGQIADSGPEIIRQRDIFFRSDGARLKLRIFDYGNQDSSNRQSTPGGEAIHGELIRYQREDCAEARRSSYSIVRTADPEILLDILAKALGIMGTVTKTRTLYLVGQTRIHIDEVEGLGDFLELEVVLRDGETEEDGKRIANELLIRFAIEPQDFVSEAYVDSLASSQLPV